MIARYRLHCGAVHGTLPGHICAEYFPTHGHSSVRPALPLPLRTFQPLCSDTSQAQHPSAVTQLQALYSQSRMLFPDLVLDGQFVRKALKSDIPIPLPSLPTLVPCQSETITHLPTTCSSSLCSKLGSMPYGPSQSTA